MPKLSEIELLHAIDDDGHESEYDYYMEEEYYSPDYNVYDLYDAACVIYGDTDDAIYKICQDLGYPGKYALEAQITEEQANLLRKFSQGPLGKILHKIW